MIPALQLHVEGPPCKPTETQLCLMLRLCTAGVEPGWKGVIHHLVQHHSNTRPACSHQPGEQCAAQGHHRQPGSRHLRQESPHADAAARGSSTVQQRSRYHRTSLSCEKLVPYLVPVCISLPPSQLGVQQSVDTAVALLSPLPTFAQCTADSEGLWLCIRHSLILGFRRRPVAGPLLDDGDLGAERQLCGVSGARA